MFVNLKELRKMVKQDCPLFKNQAGTRQDLLIMRNALVNQSKQKYPEQVSKMCKNYQERKFLCGQEMDQHEFDACIKF